MLLLVAPLAPTQAVTGATLSLPVIVGGVSDVARLEPYDVRSPDLASAAPESASGIYRGALEKTGSTLTLVLTREYALGILDGPTGPTWVTVIGGAVVEKRLPPANLGGTATEAPAFAAAGPSAASGVDGKLQVAVDGDFEYWLAHGERWDDYQLQVLSLVSAIYDANFGIEFEVVQQHVWKTQDTFNSGITCARLDEFRAYWEGTAPVMSNAWEIHNLFTGKTGDWTGCSVIQALENPNAYSVNFAAMLPFVDDVQFFTWLVAHQIGYNFFGLQERSVPTPGGLLDIIGPVTIMHPFGPSLTPAFSDAAGLPPAPLEALEVMAEGGNAPWMREYSTGRI